MGMNRYHLVGPFACSVPKPSAYRSCNRNRRNCTRQSISLRDGRRGERGGRRSACTPNANLTFAASDYPTNFPLDRFATVSNIEDHESGEIQNRNNRERSLIRGDDPGYPLNEDQEISVLEGIDAPVARLAGGREGRDNNFCENIPEIYPPVPHGRIRRPGGCGGRGRVVRDGNIDENIEEIYRPVENNAMQIIGGCNDHAEMIVDRDNSDENIYEIENSIANGMIERPVVRVHSSDNNMYRVEPGNNNQGRRPRCQYSGRRRRRNGHSSSNSVNSRCSAPRKPRENSNSSSDADISDDADLDEIASGKPWVQNCQNQNERRSSRRGRRCSSCVLNN